MSRVGVAVTSHDLDPSLYASNISSGDIDFFRKVIAQSNARTEADSLNTSDDNDEAMKQHIFDVQAKAFAVHKYDCICRFAFVRPRIATLPGYKRALELLKLNIRKEPIFLDVGCCFGNDIRKAVLDGWPATSAVACDLRREFWDIGHELFKSTPESFPATFVQGDVFDDAFLSVTVDSPPHSLTPTTTAPLNTINTLTPLVQRVSAIHTSHFFHLFTQAQQLLLARHMSALLVPEPGSIIFGQHASRPVAGFRVEVAPIHPDIDPELPEAHMYCHSPESWKKMWVEDVFGPDRQVHVDAELIEVERREFKAKRDIKAKYWVMSWSVQLL